MSLKQDLLKSIDKETQINLFLIAFWYLGVLTGLLCVYVVYELNIQPQITPKCINFCINLSNNTCVFPYQYYEDLTNVSEGDLNDG